AQDSGESREEEEGKLGIIAEIARHRIVIADIAKRNLERNRLAETCDDGDAGDSHHTIIFLKFLAASNRTPMPIARRISAFPHNSNRPAPRKMMPRAMSIMYVAGRQKLISQKMSGMVSRGKM